LYSEKIERLPSDIAHPIPASDVAFVGGMGYVVPVGGVEITGVLFELTEEFLLQAAINKLRRTIV